MKNNLIKTIFFTILTLMLIGCTNTQTQYDDNQLSLKVKNITKERVTLVITNNTNIKCGYLSGVGYLEKELEGEFKKLDLKKPFVTSSMEEYLLPKTNIEFEVNLRYSYGTLTKGKYRITTPITITTEEGKSITNLTEIFEIE